MRTLLGCNANIGPATTNRFQGGHLSAVGSRTTESQVQFPFRSPCKVVNLVVKVYSYTSDAAMIIQGRKDTGAGATNSNLVVSGINATGTYTDLTHTDSFASGDTLTWLTNVNGATTGDMNYLINATRICQSGHIQAIGTIGNLATTTTASETFYSSPVGRTESTATETDTKFYCTAATSWKNGQVRCVTNSRTTATIVRSRIDTGSGSADGNMLISCTASTTGLFTDLVNSDSLQPGYKFNWSRTTGSGSGTFSMGGISSVLEYTGTVADIFSGNQNGLAVGSSATVSRFCPFGGTSPRSTTSDTDRSLVAYYNYSINTPWVLLSTNTQTANATFGVRKNSSAGNNAVTITAGVTGYFVHAGKVYDTFSGTDNFTAYFVNGTSGAVTFTAMGFQMRDESIVSGAFLNSMIF
jgi:hypothetical protein